MCTLLHIFKWCHVSPLSITAGISLRLPVWPHGTTRSHNTSYKQVLFERQLTLRQRRKLACHRSLYLSLWCCLELLTATGPPESTFHITWISSIPLFLFSVLFFCVVSECSISIISKARYSVVIYSQRNLHRWNTILSSLRETMNILLWLCQD